MRPSAGGFCAAPNADRMDRFPPPSRSGSARSGVTSTLKRLSTSVPAVRAVAVADAVTFFQRVHLRFSRKNIGPVLFARQIGAPRRKTVGAVLAWPRMVFGLRIVSRLHQRVMQRGPVIFIGVLTVMRRAKDDGATTSQPWAVFLLQ